MTQIYRNPRESWASDQAADFAREGRYRSGEAARREWSPAAEYRPAPRSARDHIAEQNELYEWFDRDNREYEPRGYFGTGNSAGVDEFAPTTHYRGGHFYGRPSPGWTNLGYGTGLAYVPPQYEATSHRGRGPRGYERSDDRLREIICERLTDDPYIDASDVSIEVASRKVKLTGTVSDRRTKYEIEELIERSANVRDIDNQLKVANPACERELLAGRSDNTDAATITAGAAGSTPSDRKN